MQKITTLCRTFLFLAFLVIYSKFTIVLLNSIVYIEFIDMQKRFRHLADLNFFYSEFNHEKIYETGYNIYKKINSSTAAVVTFDGSGIYFQ